VWDDETCSPKIETVAWDCGHNGWNAEGNFATVDATPEVLAKYEAYEVARNAAIAKRKEEENARKLENGKVVRVVGGRKVALGTTGKIFWMGADKFNRNATRIGIKDNAGVVYWTAAHHVEVVFA
jgi:ribosomal protein S4E